MGLNWAAGATAFGEGLSKDMMKAKEKAIDVEMENIRQANYARLRKELATDRRDWMDDARAERRTDTLTDRKEGRTYKEGQDKAKNTYTEGQDITKHERAMELQGLKNQGGSRSGKTGIEPTYKDGFTLESLVAYYANKERTKTNESPEGESDMSLLKEAENVEPGMSRDEISDRVFLSLTKPNSYGDRYTPDETTAIHAATMKAYDKTRPKEKVSKKSDTGSVFEPKYKAKGSGSAYGSQFGDQGGMPGVDSPFSTLGDDPMKINN